MLIAKSGTTIPMLPLVMAGILPRSPAPGAEPMEDGAALSQGRLRVTHAPPRCFRPAYAGRILLASKSTAGRIVLIESILRAKAGASGNRRHALLVGIVAAIG